MEADMCIGNLLQDHVLSFDEVHIEGWSGHLLRTICPDLNPIEHF